MAIILGRLIIPLNDLPSLDPLADPNQAVRMHALAVFDTLFAWDPKLKPMMVDTWTVSDDRLTYTFTLRQGLRFHDGQAVTGLDVVASLRRWAANDTFGSKLARALSGMDTIGERTVVLRLRQPFAYVEMALGSAAGMIPVIMRDPFSVRQRHIDHSRHPFSCASPACADLVQPDDAVAPRGRWSPGISPRCTVIPVIATTSEIFVPGCSANAMRCCRSSMSRYSTIAGTPRVSSMSVAQAGTIAGAFQSVNSAATSSLAPEVTKKIGTRNAEPIPSSRNAMLR